MKSLLKITLLTMLLSVGGDAGGQSPLGLPLPPEENSCAACHGEKDLWDQDHLRLFVPLERLADDVHWKNGVTCNDCHGGDPSSLNFQQAHATENSAAQTDATPFRPNLSLQGRTTAHVEAVVQVCGKCHQEASKSYYLSVHGHGLQESGLVVTAICTDCHGHHAMYPAADPRSSLHFSNVGATCAMCHRFIEERLQQSIHGQLTESPAIADEPAGSGNPERKPSCIDCHQGHDLPHPQSSAFRLGLPDRCGNCHAELTNSYTRSLHGQLTELGYVPAAKCSDCHGSHDILAVTDPASLVSTVNRRETCTKCHPDATDNFLEFDPHADASNAQRDPILHRVNLGLTVLLTTVFVFFGLHSILWLVRSLPHVARRGRPKYPTPGARALVRFRPVHRIAHGVLMTSFLGLALTGLPLRFSSFGWAQAISWTLGGFSSTGLWHRIFGVTNFCCLVFYVIWFGSQLIFGPRSGISRMRYVFGPDSPVPSRRDFTDFAKMVRWFLGLGTKPTFERWTYWEKFDLWAASADIMLIGTTGLILWFPNQFCSLLPGQTLNIADLIHGKLALLATGFVFAIHFFSANLRPEKFPMDISILTGLVSEDEMEEERPELVRRLRETGQLEEHLTVTPPAHRLGLAILGGFLGLSLGLALLVAILIATL